MATKMEIRESLLLLTTSFPEWGKGQAEDSYKATLRVYEQMLADIDGPVLKQAVLSLIASAKFFPKIAEIREAAVALMEPVYPSALEAWERVTNGDKSCELANKVFRTLGVDRGDLRYMEFSTVSVNKSLFVKEYQAQVERTKEDIRMLPSVRALRQQALGFAGRSQLEHTPEKSERAPQKIGSLISSLLPKRDGSLH